MIIKNRNEHRKFQGFTLVEILLALTISSILILGINTAYQQAYTIWSSIENKRPIYGTARMITETLRQEVSCLYIPPPDSNGEEGMDDTMFRLSYLPDQGMDLTFYTLTPFWNGTLESSYIAKVSYRFTKSSDTDKNDLVRIEEPYSGDRIIGTAKSDVISNNISEFKVWVIDPNSEGSDISWKESYESKDNPPKALKVLLRWAETDKTPEIKFEDCIFISCNSPLL